MKYKLFAGFLLLGIMLNCSKRANFNELVDSASFHLEQINRLKTEYEDSDEVRELLKKALSESKKAVEINPESPTANGLYARALFASGETEKAHEAAEISIAADSLSFHGNLAMGNIYRKIGDLEKAEYFYSRAVLSDSSDVYARYSLALLLQQRRKLADAEGILERLVQIEPDNIRFLYSLAAVNEEQADLVKAERLFRLLSEKRPEDAELWRAYARLLEKGGDTVRAKTLYYKADSIEYKLYNE